jgi:putative hydrolase of the HAD superfamily
VLIRGVVVDLDDTLYDQQTWLQGAWSAVADAVSGEVSNSEFHDALLAIAAEGSDRGRIINRALDRVGAATTDVAHLVEVFRAHLPASLSTFPGVVEGLRTLRTHLPVALVTDGDPSIQRAKLTALGLEDAFEAIVFSDDLGRDKRKPHPAPFLAAATAIGIRPIACVFVGDRPDKDIEGAKAAGYAGAVRVLTGEYRGVPPVRCLATVDDFATAVDWLVLVLSGELVPHA